MKVVMEPEIAVSSSSSGNKQKQKFPIWNALFACVKIHQHKRELLWNYEFSSCSSSSKKSLQGVRVSRFSLVA